MMLAATLQTDGLRGKLLRNEPLARHTSWRCGGPADQMYIPADRDDLAAFVRQLPATEPLTTIGLGSNLLIRDGGVRGTVLLLHAAVNVLELYNGLIYAEAGVASPKVARFAAMHGLGDAEFLAGIPGTVGGALAMNAGCHGGETWRFVVGVDVLKRRGALERRTPSTYEIGYRSVRAWTGSDDDVCYVAALFQFPEGDVDRSRARIKELLTRRIDTQPLDTPNAGSVFRNPPGDHAARLIESCGLKGFAIGGAVVSTKHANFIVNPESRAKASEIERLIGHVQRTVAERTGVLLEPEVRIIGVEA